MRSRTSLTVGTIRGVEVKLHLSLLLILAYIVVVAGAQLPLVLEQLGLGREEIGLSPWLWGAIFAVGLFASVLLHELGHVFMAQRLGGRVRGITLWMLGGASEIEYMPEKRYGELTLAFVGPLVSFALAGGLFLISTAALPPGVVLITRWLASVNLILAIFNLLPAFPLDGGRMLRSWLAARYGKSRGTRWAVSVSKALSIALAIVGILGFNVLLLLIALFLYMGAQSELGMVTGEESLRGVRTGEVVSRTTSIDEGASLTSAALRMEQERSPVLPVRAASGHPAIVSLHQLHRVPRERWDEASVGMIAERAPRQVDVNEPVASAFQELVAAPAQALPVTEAGELVGVLRLSEVAEAAELRSLTKQPGV